MSLGDGSTPVDGRRECATTGPSTIAGCMRTGVGVLDDGSCSAVMIGGGASTAGIVDMKAWGLGSVHAFQRAVHADINKSVR